MSSSELHVCDKVIGSSDLKNSDQVIACDKAIGSNELNKYEAGPPEYVCPVCFTSSFLREDELNFHFDVCLNKSEINQLLQEEEGAGVGRKRKKEVELREPGLKKPRLKNNKIETYFKRS